MKKTAKLFMIAFLGSIGIANAQLEKGTFMWGGNLLGGNIQTDNAGELNVFLSPKVACFIRNGLALGGYANLGMARSYQVAIEWTYQAGILGRYYFVGKNAGNLSGSGRLFAEGNAGYGGSTIADVSSSGINWGIGPGFAYFIREHAAIEGIIKYDAFLRKNEGAINEIRFGLGFQLYLTPRRKSE